MTPRLSAISPVNCIRLCTIADYAMRGKYTSLLRAPNPEHNAPVQTFPASPPPRRPNKSFFYNFYNPPFSTSVTNKDMFRGFVKLKKSKNPRKTRKWVGWSSQLGFLFFGWCLTNPSFSQIFEFF